MFDQQDLKNLVERVFIVQSGMQKPIHGMMVGSKKEPNWLLGMVVENFR